MRIHTVPRHSAYIPQLEEDGPDLLTLLGIRITFKSYGRGHVDTTTDDWKSAAPGEERYPWTGATTFLTVDPSPNQESDTSTEEVHDHSRRRLADMSSMRPWDGDEPPMTIYDDLSSFVRREDGSWCRKGAKGIRYPVNGMGQRCAKPKACEKSEGHYNSQKRPADMSPHVWWTLMNKAERQQWLTDRPDGAPAGKVKHDFACTLVGVFSMVSNATRSLVQAWAHHLQSYDSSTGVGCSNDSESDIESVTTEEEDAFLPWDNWETLVLELGQPGVHHELSGSSSAEATPHLPCGSSDGLPSHRDELDTSLCPDNLRVARLVGNAKNERTPAPKGSHEKGMGSAPIQICFG